MHRKMPMMRKEFMTGKMDRDSAVMICEEEGEKMGGGGGILRSLKGHEEATGERGKGRGRE